MALQSEKRDQRKEDQQEGPWRDAVGRVGKSLRGGSGSRSRPRGAGLGGGCRGRGHTGSCRCGRFRRGCRISGGGSSGRCRRGARGRGGREGEGQAQRSRAIAQDLVIAGLIIPVDDRGVECLPVRGIRSWHDVGGKAGGVYASVRFSKRVLKGSSHLKSEIVHILIDGRIRILEDLGDIRTILRIDLIGVEQGLGDEDRDSGGNERENERSSQAAIWISYVGGGAGSVDIGCGVIEDRARRDLARHEVLRQE